MAYALSWMVMAVLLALWSLAMWAVHALGHWAAMNAGALGGAGAGLGDLRWPAWLAPWVPPELTALLSAWRDGLGPVVDAVMQAAPSLAPLLTALSWGVWGLGCLLLLGLGLALHWMVARWRRRASSAPAPALHSQPTA